MTTPPDQPEDQPQAQPPQPPPPQIIVPGTARYWRRQEQAAGCMVWIYGIILGLMILAGLLVLAFVVLVLRG